MNKAIQTTLLGVERHGVNNESEEEKGLYALRSNYAYG